jgi:DNA repair photolyase
MPNCGSQIAICDLPIRIDSYKGCTHLCKYCFTSFKYDNKKVEIKDNVQSLVSFIKGQRTKETNWCNWNIPLHWGGMSDPFQPIESKLKVSLEYLKILAETQYPFIVSTKGKLIADPEYLDLLSKCNCVVQVSLVSPKYDILENGAPTFQERLEIIKIVAPRVKRLNVRIQPYMQEAKHDILTHIQKYAAHGVYGITVEGMKFKEKVKGMKKVAGDYCYPIEVLRNDFEQIRQLAHIHGLKFYSGENRLRKLSDNLCCCGVEGLEWKVNTFNLNHYLYDKAGYIPTNTMYELGTTDCFTSMAQNTKGGHGLENMTFVEAMTACTRDKGKVEQLIDR